MLVKQKETESKEVTASIDGCSRGVSFFDVRSHLSLRLRPAMQPPTLYRSYGSLLQNSVFGSGSVINNRLHLQHTTYAAAWLISYLFLDRSDVLAPIWVCIPT